MVQLNPGGNPVVLGGVKTPNNDSDAANKAYVDANGGGSDLTAGTGITITDDTINISTGGVDTVQLAAGSVDTNRLGDDAVSEAKIADIAVKERHLDITNTPTAGQVLTSATDTTQFTWADAGGSNTDYNNAPFGNFDEDGSITWTFNAADDPSSQGEVSVTDNGVQGYTLRFRTADVDTINSVSVDLFQIGFGSPIAFATYAVADLTIADDFVDVSIIDGPLDGDDILATLPADNTALSIIVSVSQFRLPLSSLEDVNIPTPIGTHGLIYDGTNNEWVSSETINRIAEGGHIDVSTVAGVATLTFDETFDLWQKNDWVQINAGTPSFADDEILWDTATETLTVPSLNGRTIENILLSARTGMGIQIRRQQTNVDPVGFTSGFYQILSISASTEDDQVVVQLLPDETDIFNEPAGGTFTYELVVLQFITGGTLNNLTLNGLADTDFSTAPVAGQVLGFNSNGVWVPQDAAAADISGNVIGDLSNVSATAATDNQVLTWDDALSEWAPADSAGGGQTDTDYNNASYGALSDPAISYSYTVATSPVNEGEVSIGEPDSPTTGFTVTFRKEDVATESLQSLHLFQIGFGSPIAFATYAVSSVSINNGVTPALVVIDTIDGPLAGNDLLSEIISDGTALSISVSSNEFDNPGLGALQDVDFSTAPTDGQVIAYEASTGLWKPADDGGVENLGDLSDVVTDGVEDGYVLRYDDANSDYRVHSVGDTNRVYGGIDIDLTDTFTIPNGSGIHAIAIGNDADATGSEAIAIGSGANATFSDAVAIGQSSQAVHTDSVALGTNSSVDNAKEIRLGDHTAHVTINPTVAGNESEDNQLVSKRWVNNQISDASRVVSSTANAIENLTVVTESTPWDDYRIVPGTELVPELQVHMYEYDATEAQFIFYPGFLSDAITGDGANITTGTIPDFFEEVTDIANEAEVTNAGGTAVTSLGWKYLGHDTATVWQAVSHVYTFDFAWIYPAGNSDGTQNPPDVTSSLELVRLKPRSDNTYNMNMNATVVASSPTSFYNAGSLNPGDTESFTGSYEFAQQELADGISNVENGDVFAYRMKVRYKGNGFDGDTNVRLSITESETTDIVPQIGIRHVGRDYSLTLEDSGDLQWTDHGSAIETNLLLVENTEDGPVIPSAALGLIAGDNITISGKTISAVEASFPTNIDIDGTGAASAGTDGIAIGNGADGAGSPNAIVIGAGASIDAGQNNAISIGHDSLVNLDSASGIAIGRVATVGDSANTSSNSAFAMGNGATAVGDDALSIGANANASGLNTIAIGGNVDTASSAARASATNAIAIGHQADATFAGAVALGANAQAVHTNSVALGQDATATLANQVVLGGPAVTSYRLGATTYTPGLDRDIADKGYVDGAYSGTNGVDITGQMASIDFATETNNPLSITGTGENAGLGLTLEPLGPLAKTANGLDVLVESAGGLTVGSLTLGLQIDLDSDPGLKLTQNGLSIDADIGELNNVASTDPTAGQILHWNAVAEEWEPTTLTQDGTDLTFDFPLTVSAADVVSLNRGSGLFLDSSNSLAVNPGTGIGVSSGGGVFLNSGINGLTDVNTVTNAPTDGQFLSYDITDAEWVPVDAPSGSETLSGLTDVSISSPTEFQVISYDPLGDGSWDNMLFNMIPFSDITVSSTANRPSVTNGISDAVVIGGDTTVSANRTTAVGNNSTASATSASAIGDGSLASGTLSIAAGHDSDAGGTSSVALGDSSDAGGTNSVAIGHDAGASGANNVVIGHSAGAAGDNAVAIGQDPSTGTSALGIAIGERARVSATRGIAIGSSSNSADSNASFVTASGTNAIAIGRACTASGADSVAIGDGANATFLSSNAIGDGAVATMADSTVLGTGDTHRVFAGTRELVAVETVTVPAPSIACTTNNEYFVNGFNPSATSAEALTYTSTGDFVSGRFSFRLTTLNATTTFAESDRWTLNSTSSGMLAAFGFDNGSFAVPLGTFVIAESSYSSVAMGDFWLHPSNSSTNVVMSFRVRSAIGTPPTHGTDVSCQFSFTK